VADLVPAMLSGVSWTSSTTGHASVTSGGSGSGNNLAATVNIAAGVGNAVTFLVSGTTPSDWCVTSGNLVNPATVTAPPGVTDPNLANNSATDIDTLSVGQSPITVNSGGDDPSGPSAGTVTLRDAINAVNQGSADAIRFAIPGTPTINLAADLPALTRLVYIDGTTESGVTVNGNGFSMLDVGSTVNLKDVSFNHGKVTVETNDALNVESDFNVGVSTLVHNYGSVDVCGSFLGGNYTEVYNHNGALFNTDKDFIGGDFSFMYDFGTAAVTVGGNYSLGAFGFVYNYNTSSLRVTANFTLGQQRLSVQRHGRRRRRHLLRGRQLPDRRCQRRRVRLRLRLQLRHVEIHGGWQLRHLRPQQLRVQRGVLHRRCDLHDRWQPQPRRRGLRVQLRRLDPDRARRLDPGQRRLRVERQVQHRHRHPLGGRQLTHRRRQRRRQRLRLRLQRGRREPQGGRRLDHRRRRRQFPVQRCVLHRRRGPDGGGELQPGCQQLRVRLRDFGLERDQEFHPGHQPLFCGLREHVRGGGSSMPARAIPPTPTSWPAPLPRRPAAA
jgi:hypothetical protein